MTRRALLGLLLVGSLAAWLVLRVLESRYAEPTYSTIEPGLYQGGYVSRPPPGTRAVLNLCESEDLYRAEVHRWEPIPDAAPAPDLAWLRKMVEFVRTQREEGRPTYVHCHAGISRSGMVVVAYLMACKGWTRDEALAFVRRNRPETRPNPAFMELLARWEEELRGGRDP